MNLNSIMIGSEDPKALKDYYAKIFGTPTWEEGDFFGWQFGLAYGFGGLLVVVALCYAGALATRPAAVQQDLRSVVGD